MSDADRDVNPLLGEIYNPGEQQARLDGGIGVQKRIEYGSYMELPQYQRRRNREQPTRQLLPPSGVALAASSADNVVPQVAGQASPNSVSLSPPVVPRGNCAPHRVSKSAIARVTCAGRAGKSAGGRRQGATIDRNHERPHRIDPVHCCSSPIDLCRI